MFLVYGGLFFLLFGRILFIQVTGQAEGQGDGDACRSRNTQENRY